MCVLSMEPPTVFSHMLGVLHQTRAWPNLKSYLFSHGEWITEENNTEYVWKTR